MPPRDRVALVARFRAALAFLGNLQQTGFEQAVAATHYRAYHAAPRIPGTCGPRCRGPAARRTRIGSRWRSRNRSTNG